MENCKLDYSSNIIRKFYFISLVDVDLVEEPKEKKLRWDQPEHVIQKILNARQLLHEHDGDAVMKTKYDEK